MILAEEDLGLIRKGKRHFFLADDPQWESGRVVRLRKSGKDEGFLVTVRSVVSEGEQFRIRFTPGDSRPEKRFIARGWPDYTSDPYRAMPYEPPPMPETADEKKARNLWHALGGGSHAPLPWPKARGVKKARDQRAFVCVECERPTEGRSVFCAIHRPKRSIRTYMPLDTAACNAS